MSYMSIEKIKKSEALSKLIYLVHQGIDYTQKIAEKTNKKPSPVSRQLKKNRKSRSIKIRTIKTIK